VHGWFYGLANGRLQDLSMTVSGPTQLDTAYRQALAVVKSRYAPATMETG